MMECFHSSSYHWQMLALNPGVCESVTSATPICKGLLTYSKMNYMVANVDLSGCLEAIHRLTEDRHPDTLLIERPRLTQNPLCREMQLREKLRIQEGHQDS